ncbi:hypothetical protein UFOVP898_25 [uncultured Caudovirales phage]|uniref:Uncharacterized protein n=1 Tax=uncultured Caudovirales phage TaxID=2100421 RepID=A0A6J5QP09_9CAUD|nr:hypothetical protein UFOVP898_25 [uncultured Caudovirales phage]CAB4176474.1 hypothetical protein UFOVP985_34 [uncultured Caudovirales phage]CAB4181304.1 hypothetical protein UFOVP1073_23 [uncultured Caudovirales phage]CAB4198260.1 hypothetical protein UFOVP1308_62 [uncultured Caudovirales phage]CAB4210302.1 hypothetical protein UFOVP1423_7 [uncultured Caudovirales phage]
MSANDLAVVIPGTDPPHVETFLRDDTPDDYQVAGRNIVRRHALPEGWVLVPPPPLPVPESVEARQLRDWLIMHGHSIASIDAAIEAIPDPMQRELTSNQWNFSTSYTRRHPMFAAFVAVTQLTDDEIDQAFREAESL